ncbi:MAG: hypothetical protein Kilf2KO_32600 [Rhodospirillales bacterium]
MKPLAWSLGGLLLLLLGAALLVPAWIDWSDHRKTIEAATREASGLDLTVEGDISLRLLPSPSLTLQQVTWQGPEGIVLQVPEIVVALRLLPLLLGEVRAEALSFIAPALAAGQEHRVINGLQSLLEAPLLEDLDVLEVLAGEVPLSDRDRVILDRLTVAPRRQGYDLTLEGEIWERRLKATASLQGLGRCAGPMTLEAGLEGLLSRLTLSGQWACGEAGLDLDLRIAAAGPDAASILRRLAPAAELPAVGAASSFELDGALAWDGRSLALPATRLTLGGLELQADLSLDSSAAERRLEGRIAVPLLDLESERAPDLLPLLQASGRLLHDSGLASDMALTVEAWRYRGAALGPASAHLQGAAGQVRVASLALSLPGASRLAFTGDFGLSDGADLSGRIELASDNLRTLLVWAGLPETELPAGRLQRLALQGRLAGQAGDLRLEDVELGLDALQARGRAGLRWGGRRPRLSLALSADTLNLDAYGIPVMAWTEASDLGIDVDLALGLQRLVQAEQTVEGLQLEVAATADRTSLRRLAVADLLGARVEAMGEVDHAGKTLLLEASIVGQVEDLLDLSDATTLGDYRAQLTLSGNAEAMDVTGDLEALEGQIFVAGLLAMGRDGTATGRGDWVLALQHPSLAALLERLNLPLRSKPGALDLSGFLRFAQSWSLEELSGALGPLTLRKGRFAWPSPQAADGGFDLELELGAIDSADWSWHGDGGSARDDAWLGVLGGLLPQAAGRVELSADALTGDDWRAEALVLSADLAGETAAEAVASATLGAGRLRLDLKAAGAERSLGLDLQEVPLAPFLPPLPDVVTPEGAVSGQAVLSWWAAGQGTGAALASLNGQLAAEGALTLRPAEPQQGRAGSLLEALLGDAAAAVGRIANLSAGIERLLESLVGRRFALALSAAVEAGRVNLAEATLRAPGMTLAGNGWLDLAAWQGDYGWSLSFDSQDGRPYYEERRSGPLSTPDILRRGLLFQGATPPRLEN